MDDIGPSLPPHLLAKRKRQKEEEEAAAAATESGEEDKPKSDTNGYGPSKPESRGREGTPEKRRRMMGPIGPAMPPAPLDEMPSTGPNDSDNGGHDSDSDSSSGDDIGPALPGADNDGVDEELAARRRMERYSQREKEASLKPKRDEWMIVPPKQEEWSSKVDPTKIRARKFQSGKGARAPTAKGGDNALWTESPMEKAKRLEDEVMGVKRPATQADDTSKASTRDREAAEETKRRIEEYNAKNRNKSLYESHQTSKHKKEEDDPSKRPFDREKDIVGSSKSIGHQQKKDMLKRASDFGSRFSSGSYL